VSTAPFAESCRAVQNLVRSLARRAAVMRCRETVAECHQPMEFIIMEHTKELLSVPLYSLVPSRFNVRRHSVGQVPEPLRRSPG
jgi:hypothetical protein